VVSAGTWCTVSNIMVTSPQVGWLFSRRERSAHPAPVLVLVICGLSCDRAKTGAGRASEQRGKTANWLLTLLPPFCVNADRYWTVIQKLDFHVRTEVSASDGLGNLGL
jgi:hypothetical protein